jgi:hypothetical protein
VVNEYWDLVGWIWSNTVDFPSPSSFSKDSKYVAREMSCSWSDLKTTKEANVSA